MSEATLPETPAVETAKERHKEAEQHLSDTRQELDQAIAQVRNECVHEYQSKRILNPGKECWPKRFYLGKECKKCGDFVPRAQGLWYQVCEPCGGKMQLIGMVPGQGGRSWAHECKDCGHISYSS